MSTTTTESKFSPEALAKKVQALLAKANDPACSPAEAALYQDKAEAMMAQYRIDLAEAEEAGVVGGMAPKWSDAYLGDASSEWSSYYYTFASMAARHTGVRIRVRSVWNAERKVREYTALVLGFEHDVAYFNMLFTSILQGFSARLEPRYDPAQSEARNALRLRQGGMERGRIAVALGLVPQGATVNQQKAANRKVTNLIKAEAEEQGQPELAEEVLGRSFNAKTYRRSYAQGFLDTLGTRLYTMSVANRQAGLVLKSTKERVDEAWYEKFPEERPEPAKPEDFAPCKKCQAAKSGSCRDHSFRKAKEQSVNWSAVSKGRSAARTMDLGASRGGTQIG